MLCTLDSEEDQSAGVALCQSDLAVVICVASYGALGHDVPLDFQQFFQLTLELRKVCHTFCTLRQQVR